MYTVYLIQFSCYSASGGTPQKCRNINSKTSIERSLNWAHFDKTSESGDVGSDGGFFRAFCSSSDGIFLISLNKEKFKSFKENACCMENVLEIASVVALSILSLTAVFSYTANNDINRQAIAQQTPEKFPVPPETASQFADLIEGNDTAIILNDTNIGDVNNTVLDSIDVNIGEDCMKLPNSTTLYCP